VLLKVEDVTVHASSMTPDIRLDKVERKEM
jgi:hypothetical protein